jgi:hypothetical protein
LSNHNCERSGGRWAFVGMGRLHSKVPTSRHSFSGIHIAPIAPRRIHEIACAALAVTVVPRAE